MKAQLSSGNMSTKPITQAIEKVEALCPNDCDKKTRFYHPSVDPESLELCDWPGHRLVREVALTVHTRVLQRVSDMQGRKIDLVPEGVDAALPLELGDDDDN